jgi:hypothetical protein
MPEIIGVLTEITPAGLVPGLINAEEVGGVGQEILREASTWQMDNFGEDWVGVSYGDRRIAWWSKSAGGDAVFLEDVDGAQNVPETAIGVVVTPERFLVALGTNGDLREIAWADQESLIDWVPTAENQAGDLRLAGPGQLMAGRRTRSETLLWTDSELWALRFIGGILVYSLQQVGSNCGTISRNAMTTIDSQAIWMGRQSFFVYDGFTKALPSEVGDFVFGDINRTQASKVVCSSRAEFGEVWWYYPSSNSIENDRYVVFNYRENHWAVGALERTSDVDRSAFPFPVGADAQGRLYVHESGTSYLSPTGQTLVPFAESGPVEIGAGDVVQYVKRLIPDENTLGSVLLSMLTGEFPTDAEITHGPFAAAQRVYTRFGGRTVRLRVTGQGGDWRFGTPRMDIVAGGER